MIYQSVNPAVLQRIPPGTASLLDIGCGGGALGVTLKATMPCTVVGVTHSEAEARQARHGLDRVEVQDLNRFEPTALGRFDCIVCSHVLEHLLAPQQLLAQLHDCLNPGGVLLVALPNVLHWKQRMQFLRGHFRYTEGGLMDSTHVRFFDWDSARALLFDAGFELRECIADGGFPLSRRFGPALAQAIDRRALDTFPGLFGFQFVLTGMLATGGRSRRSSDTGSRGMTGRARHWPAAA